MEEKELPKMEEKELPKVEDKVDPGNAVTGKSDDEASDFEQVLDVSDEDNSLDEYFAENGKRSSVGCIVDFYQHGGFNGIRTRYTGDAKTVARNDDMSSLRITPGCCVRIYEHANYRGRSKKLCSDASYIGNQWNDKVSSEKLSGSSIVGY